MKAIKNRIWLVAIALIATTLGACTSDRLDVDEPVMKKVYTFTTTLPQPEYATTRVLLTEEGTGGEAKIKIAWQVGDTQNVSYDKPDDGTGSGSAIINNVDSDGVATVRVSLGDDHPIDGGKITFTYPRANNDVEEYKQKGTLEDIQKNYVKMSGIGKMIVADGSVTLDGDVEINKGTAIWKFTFTDGTNNITSDITKLTLTFSDDDYSITYEVNPTSSLDEIYVAINNVDVFFMTKVTITATISKVVYSKEYGIDLMGNNGKGKFYDSEGVELTKSD